MNLVDLPGYGYAKISKVLQNQLSDLISNYIKEFLFKKNSLNFYIFEFRFKIF